MDFSKVCHRINGCSREIYTLAFSAYPESQEPGGIGHRQDRLYHSHPIAHSDGRYTNHRTVMIEHSRRPIDSQQMRRELMKRATDNCLSSDNHAERTCLFLAKHQHLCFVYLHLIGIGWIWTTI